MLKLELASLMELIDSKICSVGWYGSVPVSLHLLFSQYLLEMKSDIPEQFLNIFCVISSGEDQDLLSKFKTCACVDRIMCSMQLGNLLTQGRITFAPNTTEVSGLVTHLLTESEVNHFKPARCLLTFSCFINFTSFNLHALFYNESSFDILPFHVIL